MRDQHNTDSSFRIGIVGALGFIGGAVKSSGLRLGLDIVSISGNLLSSSGENSLKKTLQLEHLDALIMAVGSGGGPRNRGLDREQHRLLYSQIYAALPELAELKRVVWIGSGAEYGSAIDPLTESSLPAPISNYGLSKLHETNVFLALQFLGVPVCVIRPSVVFGKMQSPGMLIPSMVASLSRGEPFFLTAPADVRDFLHVDDLADLILRSAICANVPLGIINGASGQSSAVLEVAYQLCDQMKAPRSLIRFNSPLNNSDEPLQRFSIEKAFHVLGWKPELTLTEGIERLLHAE